MRSGRLNRRVTIQRLEVTKDEFNADIESWVDVTTVWAHIEPLRGREYWQAKQVVGEVTGRITIRYRKSIDEKMRVVYGDKTYNILAVINVEEKNRTLQLLVKEILND
jgi:SPP1 family predicted phage head-tail adaptor